MKENSFFLGTTQPEDGDKVVGNLVINETHFLIMPDTETMAGDLDFESELTSEQASSTIVGHIKIGRNRYVIVDAQSDVQKTSKLTDLLTARELQIASLVASGESNKTIAKQLGISEWTVSSHMRRIFVKLGVDSRAAMVYRCMTLIQQLDTALPLQVRDGERNAQHTPCLSGMAP